MKIGILDIQGSVAEHRQSLDWSEAEAVLVKEPKDLADLAGLIIPGGESTTLAKLMKSSGLDVAIKNRAKNGMGVWGTCAGAILMARLGLIDLEIERNAYGRQQDSFETEIDFDGESLPAIFIRAPKILSAGDGCEVLSKLGENIIAVRHGKMLATTFHPELTDNLTFHLLFASLCSAPNDHVA